MAVDRAQLTIVGTRHSKPTHTDQTGAADTNSKRTPLRQSFSGKMQRLLNLKSSGSGGIDAPPSPTARAPSPLVTRSLDTSLLDEAALAAMDITTTPAGAKTGGRGGGGGGRQHGKSLWGKLGSGMKSRRTSPATAAARSSFEGATAVELPLPSNGSSAALCGRGGEGASGGGDDGASYDPHGDDADAADDGGSSYSSSPRRAGSAAGVSQSYIEETLDLRHVSAAPASVVCCLGAAAPV